MDEPTPASSADGGPASHDPLTRDDDAVGEPVNAGDHLTLDASSVIVLRQS